MFQECLDSTGRDVWGRYGTAGVTTWSNEIGAFPTRNFRSGQTPNYAALSGEVMRESMVLYDKACGLCPVPCGKYSHVRTRDVYVEGPEYETTAMLGGMCGLTNLEDVAYANWLCDDLGIDTISAGSAVAFAIECFEKGIIGKAETGGLELAWGAAAAIFTLLRRIARREGIGGLLADGVRAAAERWGHGSMDFAMQVKGMEISGYDSHHAPAMLLAYSTTDIGAHHNRAWAITYDLQAGRDTIAGKAAKVIELQHVRPLFDALGACRLQWIELGLSLEHYAPVVSAVWGHEISWQELLKASERTWNLTRLWWVREKPGFGRQDDQPPARWIKEPAVGGPTDGKRASQEMVDEMLDEYYRLRGWTANGIPTEGKLRDLGLQSKG
jgi:aldehyde:ferredoxin oxidoreductase